jgi:endonuclease/exonuclease/phosphatase family metal-dependent hydrolase
MLSRKLLFIFCFFVIQNAFCQETIKTMFYNVFDYPLAPTQNRAQILAEILEDYQPDIFMVCEIINETGADDILNNTLNIFSIDYERAPFVLNQSGPSELQQMVYFKSSKFSLETSEVIVTSVRDINRYQLKLKTEDQQNNPVFLDLYVAHLKSSPGPANRQIRLEMVSEFTATLPDLDPNSYVIFAGDLNLYNATEPAYQELLKPDNLITMADPIDAPGAWQDNPNFAYTHTQSTRLSNVGFGGGAGGGVDDRFDFILISENMLDNPEMLYVENSYKAFGNNGNCLNNRIDSPDCDGFYNQELRNRLYLMSDHLPVVMDLQTNQTFLSTPNFSNIELIKFTKGNITSDYLTIQVDTSIQELIAFEVYNVLGQKIKTITNINSLTYKVDVSGFAAGIYYLVTNQTSDETYKFLKK